MRLCLSIIIFGILLISRTYADDLHLLYPDNNVSSRPIIEFRARKPVLTSSESQEKSPGHAFVALGRELDNGITHFYQVAGFYPEPGTNKLTTFLFALIGPGEMTHKMSDMSFDDVFRATLTPAQERKVKFIIKNWDHKIYSFPVQNCVTLMKDISDAVGLKSNKSILTPMGIVSDLRSNNDAAQPLRNAKTERNNNIEDMKKEIDKLNRVKKHLYERSKLPSHRDIMIREAINTDMTNRSPAMPAPITTPNIPPIVPEHNNPPTFPEKSTAPQAPELNQPQIEIIKP